MTGRSVRSADAAKERRKATGQRVHFEAMVAVGGAEGGAAFEAESVDVSSQGMRLRTAYLPQVGDQLVCRFDGPGAELVAIGEVLWATEQSKGGEFGLKFVDLDEETEAALKELCAIDADPEPSVKEPEAKPKVAKHARVKLHIEGLASPMKARVRDGSDKEVCVGSSLEFLKLGRPVEVEDVDAGDRREGFVDAVKVEVDPSTSIPQLVVSLRFDAAAIGASKIVAAPAVVPPPAPSASKADADEPAPVTKVAGTSRRSEELPRPSKAPRREASKPGITAAAPPKETAEASDADAGEDDGSADEIGAPNKLRAAQEKAKDLTTKAAASIGPAFSKVGESAKGFFTSIKGAIDKRREARDEAKKANAPKRVTAPPPSGALTSEGRRLIRQDSSSKADAEEAPVSSPKRSKKGIVYGAAAGLALVLGIVGVSHALGDKTDEATVVASAEAKKVPTGVPPIPGAAATGDIPLFGPTPLSTTEQVVPQPAKAAKKDDAGADDGGEEPEAKSELVREFTHGEIKGGKPFLVKMNGPIEGFTATELDDGLTISVPKQQSTTSSSTLVRKDKRLSAVDVENREDAAEIRLKFKGEPPGYKVKVRGDKIEITLSKDGAGSDDGEEKKESKKVASKPATKKKTDKKATKKK